MVFKKGNKIECQFIMGNIPWNKNRKCPKISVGLNKMYKNGKTIWNKGRKCPNISESLKRGYENGRVTWNKNRKCPEISKSMKGKIPFNKNKTYEEIYGKKAKIEREKRALWGDKHWNWKGGKSVDNYPRDFKRIRKNRLIQNRDNYNCQSPGSCKGYLTIHHIDYNKENNSPENLITLCVGHNTMANKNKEYWINLYHSILSKKYGYKYMKA